MSKIIYTKESPFPTTDRRVESAKRISDLLSNEGHLSIWYEPATDTIVPDWESSEEAVWITELFHPADPDFILHLTDCILRDKDAMEMYFESHPEWKKGE